MNISDLVDRFDAVVIPYWKAHLQPTAASIKKINEHFGIVLPDELVAFARSSKSFSSFFLSLAPDYESPMHIISTNGYWHSCSGKRRLPVNLVIITQGFMDDFFWCLDLKSTSPSNKNYAIQFWCPEDIQYYTVEEPINRYPDFIHFVEGCVIEWEEEKSKNKKPNKTFKRTSGVTDTV